MNTFLFYFIFCAVGFGAVISLYLGLKTIRLI